MTWDLRRLTGKMVKRRRSGAACSAQDSCDVSLHGLAYFVPGSACGTSRT
ncbi:hypothetical protein EDF60_1437 [Leucobacter luti]|nr:hypothetical protein [Leucobacter luti]TCK46188.1 hypothetical protein EDF60_1437 [Leucobacter luti]